MEEQLGIPSPDSNADSSTPSAANIRQVGRNFTSEELELLEDDQTVQLYELRKETTKPIDKPPS